jgi:hypothetical protein
MRTLVLVVAMATRATAAAICVANPLGEDAVSDVFTAVELATNNCFDILNQEIFPDEPAIPRKLILPRPDCIPKLTSHIARPDARKVQERRLRQRCDGGAPPVDRQNDCGEFASAGFSRNAGICTDRRWPLNTFEAIDRGDSKQSERPVG